MDKDNDKIFENDEIAIVNPSYKPEYGLSDDEYYSFDNKESNIKDRKKPTGRYGAAAGFGINETRGGADARVEASRSSKVASEVGSATVNGAGEVGANAGVASDKDGVAANAGASAGVASGADGVAANAGANAGVASSTDGVAANAGANAGRSEEFNGSATSAGNGGSRPPRQKSPYVTKTFFIIALIITMILSSLISTFVAIRVASTPHSYKNLSTNSLEKATGSKLTVAQIIEKNENSVVEISTKSASSNMFGQTQISEGAGSGVIVKENGYIVTNYHVIEGASAISVTLHSGKSYTASVVGYDSENDVAVIKISASGLDAATIGDSSKLEVGDLTVAIGNPLGQLGGTATTGIISALERNLTIGNTTLTLLQTDAAINPGNSGGGLFNGSGELVGIVVAKSSGTGIEGLGFAIPINSVAETIDELITHGKIKEKTAIGIVIQDVSEEQASANDLSGEGVYIAEITSEEAKSAGLEVGDKILKFNDSEVKTSNELISKVRKCKIGDSATIVVERDGKQQTIKTRLVSSSVN